MTGTEGALDWMITGCNYRNYCVDDNMEKREFEYNDGGNETGMASIENNVEFSI